MPPHYHTCIDVHKQTHARTHHSTHTQRNTRSLSLSLSLSHIHTAYASVYLVGGTAEEATLHLADASSLRYGFAEQEHPQNNNRGNNDGKGHEISYTKIHPCESRIKTKLAAGVAAPSKQPEAEFTEAATA